MNSVVPLDLDVIDVTPKTWDELSADLVSDNVYAADCQCSGGCGCCGGCAGCCI